MSFKFPRGAMGVKAFTRLPELLSDDPVVQAEIRDFIHSVAFKSDITFQNMSDALEKYADHSGEVVKVDSTEAGAVFGSVGAGGGSLDQPRVKVVSAGKSIPNAAWTAITWDSAVYDTDSFFDGGSPTIITIPEDGTYNLYGSYWATSISTFFGCAIHLRIYDIGSAATLQFTQDSVLNTSPHGLPLDILHECSAGDTFSLDLYQGSGSALTLTSAQFNLYRVDD